MSSLQTSGPLLITRDDLSSPEIEAFIAGHVAEMKAVTPPHSKHALAIEDLRRDDVSFWSVWRGERLLACGGLRSLGAGRAEIKAMRTDQKERGSGVGSFLLRHMLSEAREAGIRAVFLETGSFAFFAPARRFYRRHGFSDCEPFGNYSADPNSIFMSREL